MFLVLYIASSDRLAYVSISKWKTNYTLASTNKNRPSILVSDLQFQEKVVNR